MQRTQKAEDMDTMERAARASKTQDDELKKSKQTIVIERIQFVGLSMQKLNEAYDDNMRLLRDFFIKWIGVDNPHDLSLTMEAVMLLTSHSSKSMRSLPGECEVL